MQLHILHVLLLCFIYCMHSCLDTCTEASVPQVYCLCSLQFRQQPLTFAHFHRRARQQQEWEERQAERKARQAEMAGEPFDKEVRCS